jgi:hypothetical protein
MSQSLTVNQALAGPWRGPRTFNEIQIERTGDGVQDQCRFVLHVVPRLNPQSQWHRLDQRERD